MALRMHENSLFAILLRSRWWLSFVVAAGVFALARLALPAAAAAALAIPFVAIGCYAAWKQMQRPGAKRIARTLEHARALPWEEFRAALEAGLRREGYEVARAARGADLELRQGGRLTLLACKRWKAARTGVEPLRELDAAAGEAHGRMYVAVGEVTDPALRFAQEKGIRILNAEDLARLLA